jgi:hypothetical protein
MSLSLSDGALRLGQSTKVRVEKLFVGSGNTKINDGTVVLSGSGKGAETLRTLWHRAKNGGIDRTFEIRLRTTPDALESIGGTPILVRNSKPAYDNASTAFVQAQHPRTIVGWTAKGETLLVTVDGRQLGHSAGMTIPEAARMMMKLGAVDAINLDGGGSTTFVVRGKVLNKPSDRLVKIVGKLREVKTAAGRAVVASNVERPVASALVVVKRPVEKPKVAVSVTPGRNGTTHAAAADLIGDLGVVENARAKAPAERGPSRVPLVITVVALAAIATAAARRRRA